MQISSPDFSPDGPIPPVFTCQGEDRSPELRWEGVPAAAKSLALIVEDPDAPDPAHPRITWTHWVLYDLPVDSTGLPRGGAPLPPGTREGKNDWKRTGWGGPCPPVGQHRYYFKLYALDTTLPDLKEPTRAALLDAISGHVLEERSVMGTYQKR